MDKRHDKLVYQTERSKDVISEMKKEKEQVIDSIKKLRHREKIVKEQEMRLALEKSALRETVREFEKRKDIQRKRSISKMHQERLRMDVPEVRPPYPEVSYPEVKRPIIYRPQIERVRTPRKEKKEKKYSKSKREKKKVAKKGKEDKKKVYSRSKPKRKKQESFIGSLVPNWLTGK